MKQVITVEDSFSTDKAGLIVSGVNSEFDPMSTEDIKSSVGSKVRVVTTNGDEFEAGVLDLSVSESLVGKKSISIALGKIEGFETVVRGSLVYAID